MDKNNQPLYVKDHSSGDVFQMLDVLKDRSESDTESFSSLINQEDEKDEELVEEDKNYGEYLTGFRYSMAGPSSYRVLDVFLEVYGMPHAEIKSSIVYQSYRNSNEVFEFWLKT